MVVVGLNVLPYLAGVSGPLRVWYAADEWAWHHLSQVRLLRPSTWGNVKEAAVKGLYERAYAPLLDRVWVVSEADRRAMRWVAGGGVRRCDAQRRGRRSLLPPRERRAAEQLRVLGPAGLRAEHPGAGVVLRPSLAGACGVSSRTRGSPFTASNRRPRVESWPSRGGVELVPDLPDLRRRSPATRWSSCRSSAAAGSRTSCWRRPPWARPSSARRGPAAACAQRTALPVTQAKTAREWAQACPRCGPMRTSANGRATPPAAG